VSGISLTRQATPLQRCSAKHGKDIGVILTMPKNAFPIALTRPTTR
jgi:hypothetical protein